MPSAGIQVRNFHFSGQHFMHKERRFVHGTLKDVFYIKEWIPAFAAVEKSPLCHSEEAQRPKNLNNKLQKQDPSLRSG